MTRYKSQIFIGVSILVLIILLMIQVQWISQARKLNEEQFRHLVGLALHESVSEFMEDQQSCYEMSECMKKLKSKTDSARLKSEIKRLNLIIDNKFKQHQINSSYTIEVLSKADKQPRSRSNLFRAVRRRRSGIRRSPHSPARRSASSRRGAAQAARRRPRREWRRTVIRGFPGDRRRPGRTRSRDRRAAGAAA